MTTEKTERKKKKRKKKHYFLRLLVFIAVCVSAYFILSSSFFDISTVKVVNNSYYTSEQIIDKAGVNAGDNLFFEANTVKMKEKLLKDPYIKNAKISRRLPGIVIISVEERKEAAAVPYADTYILIDNEGMVLRKSEVEPKVTLFIGMTIKNMEPGKPLDVEENSVLTSTLTMIKTMEEGEVYFKKIDISNVMIDAYIYDQLICRGTPDTIMENLENGNLQNVLYDLYNQGVERGVISVGSDSYCSFSAAID